MNFTSSPLQDLLTSPPSSTLLLIPAFLLPLVIYLLQPSKSSGPSPPPHITSFVPWIGSAISLGKDADGFFKRNTAKLGPIFSAKVLGKKMIYVTSAEGNSYIYRNPKLFNFSRIRRDMQMSVFGQTPAVDDDHIMEVEMYPRHTQIFQPNSIAKLVQDYTKYVEADVKKLWDEVGEGKVIDARNEIYKQIFNGSIKALVSPTIEKPGMIDIFYPFDIEFPLLAAGLPSFVLKKGKAAREKAFDFIIDWLRVERARENYEQAKEEWGNSMKLLVDVSEQFEFSERDTASLILGEVWALTANAPWAGIWAVTRLARNLEWVERIREEVKEGLKSAESVGALVRDQKLIASDTFSFLHSAVQETLRHDSTVFSIRRATEDVIVPIPKNTAGSSIKKGETVYCVTRTMHMDENIYEGAGEFVPERFTREWRKVKGLSERVQASEFSPWGGGVSICDGRHFAMHEIKILVILLFHMFDIEPLEPNPPQPDPSRGPGAGVMWLKGGHKVRLTRRDYV